MFDCRQPFALLWDVDLGAARLFTGFRRWAADLRAVDDWLAGGISYEAGHVGEPRLAGLAHGEPWMRMGRFGPPALLDFAAVMQLLQPFRGPVAVGEVEPLVARDDWLAAVGRVQDYVAAGDIYQANLTFPAQVAVRGHPLALFARLFSPAAAPHGGVMHDGAGRWWLSLSPELFFTLADGVLTARPMKGTAARPALPEADRVAAAGLAADGKNRAENLMITDLIRNDLSRVAVPGSVKVPELFRVESYPSVHQMTSTVTAQLAAGLEAADVVQALFPCGSVTGAPKIRAMQVIAELEAAPRGLYCGSLGWIAPAGRAARFNVAIRTLELCDGTARLGLGAGIVADSIAADEWEECLTKGRFLHASRPRTLIETMRLGADGRIARIDLHLHRLGGSAARFGFRFDAGAVGARLRQLPEGPARRLRLLLDAGGAVALQLSPLPAVPSGPVQAAIVPLPIAAGDWRLAHKTGDRDFYDRARSENFEVVFERPDGLLTEGSFTSLFVERDGVLLTPPIGLGLLPGVLRAELLASGQAVEAELRCDDLAGGFWLGNSVRGLFAARL
ncbi:aminodeoxychorismate synthase component I [Sandaracinobacteroides hominis]|uniref:aminodeoxychorismate synthase component I n=1 Tax=Sandaracinobacteroides hominis TaxID=2780086 RepID=UPI0018F387AC|nr:aminodeoxychorismate synthase component I [Sandaracinobacteroides hominis]